MLEKVGLYNDLSDGLRKILEDKIVSFGKRVRFKFNISNRNPDPEQKSGAMIFPFLWTLDPITFNIIDPHEDRKNVQKVKKIGIVEETNEKGEPSKFRRIRISEQEKGIVVYDLTKIEDIESTIYLLIHPKLTGGIFANKDVRQVISLIDEQAVATEQRNLRVARKKATDVAAQMSDKEVVDFADAMSGGDKEKWDSTQDNDILRNEVEILAETSPEFFNDLVAGKKIEYQATVKQAITKGIITFDPGEYKFTWTSNSQTIAVLQPVGNKNEIEKLAEFFQTGGEKADVVYKKIKALITEKPVTV